MRERLRRKKLGESTEELLDSGLNFILISNSFAFVRRAAQSTFFPPVKGAQAKVTQARTATERAAVLQSALTTIIVMSGSILLGIVGYISVTIYIAITFYEASITSPSKMESIFRIYNLQVGEYRAFLDLFCTTLWSRSISPATLTRWRFKRIESVWKSVYNHLTYT